MNLTYMRPNLPDDYGLLPVQDKILSIAVYLDKFCAQHGVEYCLMGGSALGAKRHGGFIPWDDDLDVFMTVPNYEKFRQGLIKKGIKIIFTCKCGAKRTGWYLLPKCVQTVPPMWKKI